MSLHGGASRFGTSAITIVGGLHLFEAGEGGLEYAVSGRVRDRVVKQKRKPVEVIRMINEPLGLIDKIFQPVPFIGIRPYGGEGGDGRLNGVQSIQHLGWADLEDVIGDCQSVRGVCKLIDCER